jgi:hypothetical protein
MREKSILQLLEENEINISSLYSIYAEKIPTKHAFWKQLSNEEISHATSINANGINTDKAESIEENNFSRGVIKYVMDFVLNEIENAKKNETTHFNALHTALRIERSILEKKCFDVFIPTSATIKEIFQKMNEETEQHIEILTQELKNASPIV